MQQQNTGVAGFLGKAAGQIDVVGHSALAVHQDGVREHDIPVHHDEVGLARNADDIARFEPHIFHIGAIGEHHLTVGLNILGALDPLHQQLCFAVAQFGFPLGRGAGGQDTGFQRFEGGVQHLLLTYLDRVTIELDGTQIGILGQFQAIEDIAETGTVV